MVAYKKNLLKVVNCAKKPVCTIRAPLAPVTAALDKVLRIHNQVSAMVDRLERKATKTKPKT